MKNVVASQNYVSEFALDDYPVTEADILAKGEDAWNAALNTVNVGKYNLGWASIGMCTHAFYEAINHAANRRLYGMHVTDFPHVKRMFVDAYARLVAMKLFALRAADYMRVASAEDRRYLLYNPMVKMKVTTQGEDVIEPPVGRDRGQGIREGHVLRAGRRRHSRPAEARGDGAREHRADREVHAQLLLRARGLPRRAAARPGGQRRFPVRPGSDQGPREDPLSRLQHRLLQPSTLPNVKVFREQIEAFKEMLVAAPPDEHQRKDIDFLLAGGELFALVVYGQLILENAKIYEIADDLVDQIFDFMVRDFSGYALKLYSKPSSNDTQMAACQKMIRKPVLDEGRYGRVWQEVYDLKDEYEMNP